MAKFIKTAPKKQMPSLLKDQRGVTTVEYIILLCLIAVVGFAVWKKFGETVKERVGEADGTMGTMSGTAE